GEINGAAARGGGAASVAARGVRGCGGAIAWFSRGFGIATKGTKGIELNRSSTSVSFVLFVAISDWRRRLLRLLRRFDHAVVVGFLGDFLDELDVRDGVVLVDDED